MLCFTKSFFTSCILVLCFVQGFYSSIVQLIAEDPKYPGQCYFNNVTLSPNETAYNPVKNQCCKLSCTARNEHYWATYECCLLNYVGTGCSEISTLALAFPDCCESQICAGEDV